MTLTTIPLLLWWLAILWTYSELFARPFDDWKNTLLYMGAGILVIAVTTRRRSADPVAKDYTAPPVIPLFIGISYFLLCAVSIAAAPSGKYEGLLELARLMLWAGLAWVFAQCSSRIWLWLMRLTVISAAIIAALTWMQLNGSTLWPYGTPWLAPIGHITYYGDFMALSWVMAIGLMFQPVILRAAPEGSKRQTLHSVQGDKRQKTQNDKNEVAAIYLLPIALIDVGVALAATRASMAGIVAGLMLAVPLVGYATRSYKKMAIIALIGVINLAIIFFMPIKSMRGASAGERIRQTASFAQTSVEVVSSGRWHTYVTSARIAMERPLMGWGLGSFRFVYPEFAHRDAQDSLVSSKVWYMHPHNELLHQAVEVGVFGAFLFFIGFLYLLYKGAQALKPIAGTELGTQTVFLITALCGITAAFVSWQFSTNFLFPVSRLMTALFGGIILQGIAHSRSATKFRITTIVVVGITTLFLASYQLSLTYLQARHAAKNPDVEYRYARWAVNLAPGAFDTLFAKASAALRKKTPRQNIPEVESLYESYPYVPAVIYMMGAVRAQQGNIPEARKLLQHALQNDPGNIDAKLLLDRLPPTH